MSARIYQQERKVNLVHNEITSNWLLNFEERINFIPKDKNICLNHDTMVVFELVDHDDGRVIYRQKPIVVHGDRLKSANVEYPVSNEMKISHCVQTTFFTRDAELPSKPIEGSKSLLQDFKKLFEHRESADARVKASDGAILCVHKLILATRSSVFRTMFDIEMTEKETSFAEIKDFDSTVLLELFRFMYCGEVETNEEINLELLRAAKRYEISELPQICENFIIEHSSGVDIWFLLGFAHTFDLQQLFEFLATIFFV